MLPLTISIQHSTQIPSLSNQGDNRCKRHPNQKGRSNIISDNDMILHVQNPKDFTKKLLELINKFSKFTGDKINVQNKMHSYTLTTNYSKIKLRK